MSDSYNPLKVVWEAAVQAMAHREGVRRGSIPAGGDGLVLTCAWSEPNQKRDPDNVAGAGTKIILDALVKMGALHCDGWHCIRGIRHTFDLEPEHPGVLVVISRARRGVMDEDYAQFRVVGVLPGLNDLLAAREQGARRSVARIRARRPFVRLVRR